MAKPALLAWNGSQSTANALRDAVPLLHHMEPVHILAVNDDNEEFPAARALEYLSHHAIRSEVHWRRAEGKITVAEAIIGFAQEMGTELIVAGAFGHNLLREMLLGSVTRALLKSSRRPLFLAH
jgi:nucleotide-binding universal stress UspA family protein